MRRPYGGQSTDTEEKEHIITLLEWLRKESISAIGPASWGRCLMTDLEKKERLRKVLDGLNIPVHCSGCDEWGCGGVEESGAFHEFDDEMVESVWNEIQSWRTS